MAGDSSAAVFDPVAHLRDNTTLLRRLKLDEARHAQVMNSSLLRLAASTAALDSANRLLASAETTLLGVQLHPTAPRTQQTAKLPVVDVRHGSCASGS